MNFKAIKTRVQNADGSVRVAVTREPLPDDAPRTPLREYHEDVFVPRARKRRRTAIEHLIIPENAKRVPYPHAAPIVDERGDNSFGPPFALMNENEMVLRDKMRTYSELNYPKLLDPARPHRYYVTCSISMLAVWLGWSKSRVQRTMEGLIQKKIVQPWNIAEMLPANRRGKVAFGSVVQRHTSYVLPEFRDVLAALRDDPNVILSTVPIGEGHHVVHVYGHARKLVTKSSPLSVRVCLDESLGLHDQAKSGNVGLDATSVQLSAHEPAVIAESGPHRFDTSVLAAQAPAGSVLEQNPPEELPAVPATNDAVPEILDEWSDANLEVKFHKYAGHDNQIPVLFERIRMIAQRGALPGSPASAGVTISNREIWDLATGIWMRIRERDRSPRYMTWWQKAFDSALESWIKAKLVEINQERLRDAKRREDFEASVRGAYEAHDTDWLRELREVDREGVEKVLARIRGATSATNSG